MKIESNHINVVLNKNQAKIVSLLIEKHYISLKGQTLSYDMHQLVNTAKRLKEQSKS